MWISWNIIASAAFGNVSLRLLNSWFASENSDIYLIVEYGPLFAPNVPPRNKWNITEHFKILLQRRNWFWNLHIVIDCSSSRPICTRISASILSRKPSWIGFASLNILPLCLYTCTVRNTLPIYFIFTGKSHNHDSTRPLLKPPEQEKELPHPSGKENKEKIGNGMKASPSLPNLTEMHRRQNGMVQKSI